MNIQLLVFAKFRDVLGMDTADFTLPFEQGTVGDLIAWLCQQGPQWQSVLGGRQVYRVAVNQILATPDTLLSERAEVAIFPPVTGG
ncbi:molybdopterin converting factor subunit 1 [Burkholderiaceae bacterium DAT-1]|nr:molybdopterin converting factor subunit 1 [Burkholderiaceae bacterium DAT-1]